MPETFSLDTHNPKRILVVGDWHRNPHAAWPKIVIKLAEDLGIDTIVHLGDFGYKFGTDDAYTFEKPLHEALRKSGIRLFWVDGNHENHEYLQDLIPHESGFVQTGARGNIYYAPRGHRWTWSGRTFGALGGAWSINRNRLIEGKTVFAELEEPTAADLERLATGPLDYLLAHDVPGRVILRGPGGAARIKTQTAELLQKAVDSTRPKRVFSGHWHRRVDYRLPLHGGGEAFGHILDREWNGGNVLVLDLETDSIVPLPESWTNYGKGNL